MTVIAALLIASCLLPEAAPPDLSNSLAASDMARWMRSACEVEPLDPEPGAEPWEDSF